MFKPSPYEGLQTLFAEGKELSDKERLLFALGPLLSWYRENKRDLPWRGSRDAYRIWISEIMLQQTRVEAVKPYYFRFMERFPNIRLLAEVKEEELLKHWEGLGYYSRARNLKKAAQAMMETSGGKFPDSYEKIIKLPGIGSYTAGAIASIAYDLPTAAVDGNVLRVLSRVLGSHDDILKQSTRKKMECLVEDILKERGEKTCPGDFNQALIEVGAVVCIPNGTPLCEQCPFYTVCMARSLGIISELPVKTFKKKRKIEEKTVLLLEYKDKIAIRKRSQDGLLASMYEFINIPGRPGLPRVRDMFPGMRSVEELPGAKHVFSHTEWHIDGYFLSLGEVPEGDFLFAEWETIKKTYAIPSAFTVYKKYLDHRYGGKKT